jgi:uncharacterized protein (UPF0332 family)
VTRDRGRSDPPKKKRANKPRPNPIKLLSEDDRARLAQAEFNLAMIHLGEAEKLAAWSKAPNACVHAAYYAMHHCARAAILKSGGVGKRRDVPNSHEHVIEHYGNLVEGETNYLGQSARELNKARSERVKADYGIVVGGATREDAAYTAGEARRFVEACARKWMLIQVTDYGEWLSLNKDALNAATRISK